MSVQENGNAALARPSVHSLLRSMTSPYTLPIVSHAYMLIKELSSFEVSAVAFQERTDVNNEIRQWQQQAFA